MENGMRLDSSILTVKEVAEILRISQSKAYELLGRDVIPHLRLGTRYVIPKDSFMAWIHKTVRGGKADAGMCAKEAQ